ncbi:MAG: glutathione synthase [Ruminococcus sp.]|nr:glutathione synthase [Ruminococcus sp.]
MLLDLSNSHINRLARTAEFGVERESLRLTSDGRLAQTKHPFDGKPYITRDFCENQVEMIGGVFTDPDEVNLQLGSLLDEIDAKLIGNNELLWAFSNPPRFDSEDEIPIAEFYGSQRDKSEYRHYLAEKYGKTKMLFSGIHLNISFTESLLQAAFEESGEAVYTKFKNDFYLRLAKRLTQYAWLAVFLTAASPVADASLKIKSNVYSSIRCSEHGYWNDFTPILDYSNLKKYVGSIGRYILKDKLKAASELYYPVRLKPRGANSLEMLYQNGVNHLELRVLDVNPLTRTGIFTEDIRFFHLLLLWLCSLTDFDFDEETQRKAIADVKAAAVFGNTEIKRRAKKALEEIKSFAGQYFPNYLNTVEYQLNKLIDGNSYAEIVSRKFSEDYMAKGLALARAYQRGEYGV